MRVFQNAIYPKTFQVRLDFYNTGDIVALKQAEYQNFYLDRIYAFDTYAFRDVSLPSIVSETDYVNGQPAVSKITSYGYSSTSGKPILFTPPSESVKNSNGEDWVTRTVFPYNDTYINSEPYKSMVTKNMLDYPLEVKIEKGSNNQFVNQTFTSYKQVSNMILPDVISVKYTSNGAAEPRIVYNNYDSHGNPMCIIKDNVDTIVYLWGYNYQYPIVEIRGATYQEVMTKMPATLNSILTKIDPEGADFNSINSVRNALPNAQFTTYTYKPLIGIESITDPRGITMRYEYDSFGRLMKIIQNGKVMESYDYHYKN